MVEENLPEIEFKQHVLANTFKVFFLSFRYAFAVATCQILSGNGPRLTTDIEEEVKQASKESDVVKEHLSEIEFKQHVLANTLQVFSYVAVMLSW